MTADEPVDLRAIHHVDELEEIARRHLPHTTYTYVAGGAGGEATVRNNRESLDRLRLVPRVMRDMTATSPKTTVLGREIAHPLLAAPTAVQRLAHPDGELATARAVRDAGSLMILSMNASTSVEEVCNEGVPCWMQLYISPDRPHVRGIVERAVAAGVEALCLTVDHAGMPTRPRELHTPLVIPPEVPFVHLSPDPAGRGVDGSVTWDVVEWLREISDLPLVLKGILHPADAAIAADLGVAAIIVSNHGGRQLDTVVSGYEVLPSVLEAVGDRCEVLVDGGIRTGTDLMKAVALGARAALVGRPLWWGLAAGGEQGVARMFELICNDFTETMRLCGCVDMDSVGRHLLWER